MDTIIMLLIHFRHWESKEVNKRHESTYISISLSLEDVKMIIKRETGIS